MPLSVLFTSRRGFGVAAVLLAGMTLAAAAVAATADAGASAAASAPGSSAASAASKSAAAPPSGSALYKVVDGTKVDPGTLEGFRTWRAAACSRCHGANQEGLVGPSLINSLKTLSKQDFVTTVTNGRLEKGMPSFKESKMVMENIDHLYAYLKGRSDGAITAAHVYPMN
jgi:mono/diheme cytochrome c family protein